MAYKFFNHSTQFNLLKPRKVVNHTKQYVMPYRAHFKDGIPICIRLFDGKQSNGIIRWLEWQDNAADLADGRHQSGDAMRFGTTFCRVPFSTVTTALAREIWLSSSWQQIDTSTYKKVYSLLADAQTHSHTHTVQKP